MIDKMKMDQLRDVILGSQRSPIKSVRASTIAHFQEFSDINSEEEDKIKQENNHTSKKNLKKPPMKVEISSIESIETIERTHEIPDPSNNSYQHLIDINTVHSRKLSRQELTT